MSFIVAANWKMNKGPQQTKDFFSEFFTHRLPKSARVIFFVSSVNGLTTAEAIKSHKGKKENSVDEPSGGELHSQQREPVLDGFATTKTIRSPDHRTASSKKELSKIKTSTDEGKQVFWGPQNVYHKADGAFTGETSPQVMKALGADYVLVGHSERRYLFHEGDEQIKLKTRAVVDFGMSPVLCVGETLGERRAGRTLEVLERQLAIALQDIKPKKELHISYEPVWAIGTGEVADTGQVSQAHRLIREFLKNQFGSLHQEMKILYGGSVKAEKVSLLMEAPEVGGFLVGGASLEPGSFLEIIRAIKQAY